MCVAYKRLGDYIVDIDERNRDLSIQLSQGINNNKYFQEPRQVAVNSTNDKIVRRGQFAYNRATTRNGDKISIAYREGEDCTVSSAYQVFYIKDEDELNPYYLLLWFKRPAFDRYARFKSHGSAHEFFEWDEMCNVMLPVPPIEEQRRIVAQYQAVEKRIRNNEQLIARLEDTAQTIFHHRFVDNIDPNNLPDGWGSIDIGAFCKQMVSGGTPNRKNDLYYDKPEIPWLKSGEVHNNVILDTEEYISRIGYDNSAAKMVPDNTVVMAMYGATASEVGFLKKAVCTNQACCNMICDSYNDACYLYYYLRHEQEEIKRLANGGAQENLNKELISSYPILRPNDEDISVFSKLMDYQVAISKEISLDKSIIDLIVSQMV